MTFSFFLENLMGECVVELNFPTHIFYMSLQLILFLQILLVSHVAAPFDYVTLRV